MKAHSHSTLSVLTTACRGAAAGGRSLGSIVSILALQVIVSYSEPSAAAIYKCVSAAGETTYTSAPCAHEESTQRISSNATAVAGLDCRIARKLAFDTSGRMKQGENSTAVFDSHGGMDSLSPLVIGLISYIYTFEGNDAVSASRIATLATDRCQVGSFGPSARHCESYPHEFVQQLGGCEAARDESSDTATQSTTTAQTGQPPKVSVSATEPAMGAASAVEPTRYAPPASSSGNKTDDVIAATRSVNERATCRQRLSTTLQTVSRGQGSDASSLEQQQLQALQRQLRMQLARC